MWLKKKKECTRKRVTGKAGKIELANKVSARSGYCVCCIQSFFVHVSIT